VESRGTYKEISYNKLARYNKKKKKEKTHTDRCGNTCRQKCCAKGKGKEAKIQEFMYRMWNPKCKILSVIIGATGIVTKCLRKNLEAIPENIQ
jgi:hypothetical protein